MIYKWYKIFNLDTFLALDLVSKTYTFELTNIGIKDILVTKGALTSIVYEGVMLPVDLNTDSLFEMDGHASFIDYETNDCYLGIL